MGICRCMWGPTVYGAVFCFFSLYCTLLCSALIDDRRSCFSANCGAPCDKAKRETVSEWGKKGCGSTPTLSIHLLGKISVFWKAWVQEETQNPQSLALTLVFAHEFLIRRAKNQLGCLPDLRSMATFNEASWTEWSLSAAGLGFLWATGVDNWFCQMALTSGVYSTCIYMDLPIGLGWVSLKAKFVHWLRPLWQWLTCVTCTTPSKLGYLNRC